MYVFDTNVLSEVMKAEPHPSVAAWLKACPAEAMFTTAISRSEILYGIRRLPDGARRRRLERAAQAMFARELDERILALRRPGGRHLCGPPDPACPERTASRHGGRA
jgi:predicted nucleic acid-binding protein